MTTSSPSLQVPEIEQFFSMEGPLSSTIERYETRDEQSQIAREVAEAINSQGKLVAEAGTGTGKTLAYLVPAIASGLRVVISTGTKTLQDQIIEKELPLLEKAVGKSFHVQLMKGRSNYLCHLRAGRFAQQPYLPSMPQKQLFDRIQQWKDETTTGDRAELSELPDDSPLWAEVSATSDQCTGRRCADYERCWVTQMRRSASNAQIIIVNHHLYFADAMLRSQQPASSSGESGLAVIPTHDMVIFDEAHDLDEVAAQHYGIQVSDRRIMELTRDFSRDIAHDPLMVARFSALLGQIEIKGRQFFEEIPRHDNREPFTHDSLNDDILGRFAQLDELLGQLEAEVGALDNPDYMSFCRRAAQLSSELAFLLYQPGRSGLLASIEKPLGAPSTMDFSPIIDDPTPVGDVYDCDGEDTDPGRPPVPYVRFTESSQRNRSLVARPLDVAPLMEYTLDAIPSVFISATLAVKGSFEHYRSRVGLAHQSDVRETLVESPFDYASQVRLYLPKDIPEPNHPDFPDEAAQRTIDLVNRAGGGAFVLCTSKRMVRSMATALETHTPFRVLLQGQAPRTRLLNTFRQDGHAVLVATMSFWQGIDVPGAALRLVIIDKLPFASPGDPVVAARLNHLKSRGLSPFSKYQLPQAAILLRQGFGRLIRRKTDRGLIAILDRRMTQKGYGKVFLKSLPPCPLLHDHPSALDYLSAIREELS